MFILRKHDFSKKLTGGTGLQGVNSNLNLRVKQIFQQNYSTKAWLFFGALALKSLLK